MIATSPYTLFVFRSSPYGTSAAREGIDALLACSVFELPLKLLFMNDGVYQLLTGQSPTNTISIEKQLKSLGLYGIDDIYVHEPSVSRRSIPLPNLLYQKSLVSNAEVGQLFSNASHIVSF